MPRTTATQRASLTQQILFKTLDGLSMSQIAKDLGKSVIWVTKVVRSPSFQSSLEQKREDLERKVIEKKVLNIAEIRNRVGTALLDLSINAKKEVLQIEGEGLNALNLKNTSAQEVLELLLGPKGGQPVPPQQQVVQVAIDSALWEKAQQDDSITASSEKRGTS